MCSFCVGLVLLKDSNLPSAHIFIYFHPTDQGVCTELNRRAVKLRKRRIQIFGNSGTKSARTDLAIIDLEICSDDWAEYMLYHGPSSLVRCTLLLQV
jgi:hypothetical protein